MRVQALLSWVAVTRTIHTRARNSWLISITVFSESPSSIWSSLPVVLERKKNPAKHSSSNNKRIYQKSYRNNMHIHIYFSQAAFQTNKKTKHTLLKHKQPGQNSASAEGAGGNSIRAPVATDIFRHSFIHTHLSVPQLSYWTRVTSSSKCMRRANDADCPHFEEINNNVKLPLYRVDSHFLFRRPSSKLCNWCICHLECMHYLNC